MIKYLFLSLLCFTQNHYVSKGNEPEETSDEIEIKAPYNFTDFSYLRDTVYTLENSFIEIDISKQIACVHFRSGSVKEFGVSTGTSRIEKGLETKEGLFVIQTKAPKLYSVQFDSTLMLNWMGFNYGIGFHALLGKKYYKYLGTRKSSHGCVRISREIAKEIYDTIKIGTPVLVHSGKNVVHIGFADSSDSYISPCYQDLKQMLPSRYKAIYDGMFFVANGPKILIDKNNVEHSGLPIGERSRIPRRQITLPFYSYVGSSIPKELNFDCIVKKSAIKKFQQSLQF